MVARILGLFVCEGSSDQPLLEIITDLFAKAGAELEARSPDFSLLGTKVGRDVASKIRAGLDLAAEAPHCIIVHRDADNAGHAARVQEIQSALTTTDYGGLHIPVVPARTTEAWLLLDEQAIRTVAENPAGRVALDLPTARGRAAGRPQEAVG